MTTRAQLQAAVESARESIPAGSTDTWREMFVDMTELDAIIAFAESALAAPTEIRREYVGGTQVGTTVAIIKLDEGK